MGQEAGSHEGIHVARVGAQLQVGHVGGNFGQLDICLVAHHHGVSAGQGGVADVVELLQLHVREHANVHGVLHVDAGADAAGHIHLVNGLHAHVHAGKQGGDGGEDGALGPDEIVDVHLVDGHLPAGFGLVGVGDDVAAHAMRIPPDPVTLPDEQTLGIDDAAAEELGDDVDDAGAADAHRPLARFAHNGKGGLHGVFVQGAGLNGAVGGPHAAGDVAALKGWAGGAGAAHHKVPVAEHDLAVGAQVDEQAHLVLVPQSRGQGTGGDVTAHIGADVGCNEHGGQGVGRELHIPGQQSLPAKEAGDIGLHPHGLGIHPHKQVVHGGVGAHAEPKNAPGGDSGSLA